MSEEQEVRNERGERGQVGEATAAGTVKSLWHKAYFIKDKQGLTRKPQTPSLKAFARTLVKEGDTTAQSWFAHKAEVNKR